MAIELIKMDRRHRGINYFSHYANFVRHRNTRNAPRITGWAPVGGYVTDQDVVKEFVKVTSSEYQFSNPGLRLSDDVIARKLVEFKLLPSNFFNLT